LERAATGRCWTSQAVMSRIAAMLAVDLHTHSWYSDGVLSPEALISRAASLGIEQLAITDHDSVGAWHSLQESTIPAGIHVIPGVEISTLWGGREIHIIGLLIDCSNIAFSDLLQYQQFLRRERALEINRKLHGSGIDGLMTYLDTLPCEAISRNHIADFLIQKGHVTNRQQAFKRLLGDRGRYAVTARWCSIAEAIQTIRQANGIAVLAHPDRYRFGRARFTRLLEDFREAGGEGLEVSYSNLNPDKLRQLGEMCTTYGFWASAGSDFHTPARKWMDIGRIRQLPASCRERPIWHHPRWNAPALNAA